MLNLSDKELDRLSQEAAEKYEMEQHFGTWNKLEELLNKELGKPSTPIPRIAKPGISFFYVPAAILLAGIASYFLIKPTKHNINSTPKSYQSANANTKADRAKEKQKNTIVQSENAQHSTKPKAVENGITDKNNNAGNVDNSSSTVSSTNSTVKNQTDATVAERTTNAFLHKKQNIKINDTQKLDDVTNNAEKRTLPNTQGDNSDNENVLATAGSLRNVKTKNNPGVTPQKGHTDKLVNHAALVKTKSVSGQKTPLNNTVVENLKMADIAGLQPLPHHATIINDAALKNANKQSSLINAAIVTPGKKNKNRSLVTSRPLEFGIVYSPDFSRVKYNYNNRIGDNFGFTIDYQLSDKLSVNSGFIFTTKNYGAEGRDFHLPPNCGIDQDDLEFAVANVHMYEIPLNLRYDFSKANNVFFFVNAGFSSYISHKENYKFYLHNNYNPLGNWGWLASTYQSNQAYLFSVLNLSAGFEAKLSNTVSLQVEPYVKLPLSGVGFGRVDLSSYGINTAIKFAPLLKRSRK